MRKNSKMRCLFLVAILTTVSQLTTYSVDYNSTIQNQETTEYNLNTVANEKADLFTTEKKFVVSVVNNEIPTVQASIEENPYVSVWTNKETPVYTEMNMETAPIDSLYQGYNLEIEKINDKWCRITSNNTYITTDNISYKEVTKNLNITNWVTCDLNFRVEPTTESDVILTLEPGSTVTVMDNREDGWSQIIVSDKIGFVKTQYLSETEYIPPKEISLGKFKITHYCDCVLCCGQWSGLGLTASGAKLQEGVTIAVDPDVIPYGTEVIINGHSYIAQDCGGGVKNNHIDIYVGSHEEALQKGTYTVEVFIVND